MSTEKEKSKDMFLVRLPDELRKALLEKKTQTKLPINTLILTAIKTSIDNNWGEKK